MFGVNGKVLLVCSILCSCVIASDYGYAFINSDDSEISQSEDAAQFHEQLTAEVAKYYKIMAEEQHDSDDEDIKSVDLKDAIVVFDDLKFDDIAGDFDLQTELREAFLGVADKEITTVVLIKCKNRDEKYRQEIFQIILTNHPEAIYMYIDLNGNNMSTIPETIQKAYTAFSLRFAQKKAAQKKAEEEKKAKNKADEEKYSAGEVDELE